MEGLGEDGQPMTKNRRHRTLRQQMLNKQAQQRYRCAFSVVPPAARPCLSTLWRLLAPPRFAPTPSCLPDTFI